MAPNHAALRVHRSSSGASGGLVGGKKLTVDTIRATGTYEVTAKLAPEVSATFKVNVVADAKSSS